MSPEYFAREVQRINKEVRTLEEKMAGQVGATFRRFREEHGRIGPFSTWSKYVMHGETEGVRLRGDTVHGFFVKRYAWTPPRGDAVRGIAWADLVIVPEVIVPHVLTHQFGLSVVGKEFTSDEIAARMLAAANVKDVALGTLADVMFEHCVECDVNHDSAPVVACDMPDGKDARRLVIASLCVCCGSVRDLAERRLVADDAPRQKKQRARMPR